MGRGAARGRLNLQGTKPVEAHMNEDKLKGQWKQLSGKLKAKWGKLTDDDVTVASGTTEYLEGKLQERYGLAREEAKRQVKEFSSRL